MLRLMKRGEKLEIENKQQKQTPSGEPDFRVEMDSALLRRIAKCVTLLGNEVYAEVTTEQMHIFGVDTLRVMLFELPIRKDQFAAYNVSEPGIMTLTDYIFPKLDDGPVEVYTSTVDDKRQLNYKQGKVVQTYNAPSMMNTPVRIPDLKQYRATVLMDTKDLISFLSKAKNVSDSIVITTTWDGVVLSSKSDSMTVTAEFAHDDGVETVIRPDYETDRPVDEQLKDEIRSAYSIEFLTQITRIAGNRTPIALTYGKNYPLKAKFELWNGISVEYLLAPRME